MINNVKVSLSSVKSFTQAVAAIRDYSTQFDKGIRCLDDFLYYLINKVSSLRGAIEKMQDAPTDHGCHPALFYNCIWFLVRFLGCPLDRLCRI